MIFFFQRVLTPYRQETFKILNKKLDIKVFFGQKTFDENIRSLNHNNLFFYKIKNFYFKFRSEYILFQTIPIIQIIKFKPKTIVFEANPRIISVFFLKALCLLLNIKLYGWGLGYLNSPSKLKKIYYKFFFNNFKKIAAYSTKSKIDYLNYLEDKNIKIIQNYTYVTKAKKNNQKKFKNIFQIVFLGRLIESKNLEYFVKILKNFNDYELIIIGDGNPTYMKKILNLFTLNRVKSRFYGHLVGEELSNLLKNSDLMILPGNGGLAINHALFNSLPIICSFADGTEMDLIINGYNGYIAKNINDYRLYLKKIMNLKNRNKLKFNSKRIYNMKISQSIFVNNWLDFLNLK